VLTRATEVQIKSAAASSLHTDPYLSPDGAVVSQDRGKDECERLDDSGLNFKRAMLL